MQGCVWILTRCNKQSLSPPFSIQNNETELFPIVYQITLEHDFLCKFSAQKIRFMQALHAEMMTYGVRQPTLGLTKVAAPSQHLFCRTPFLLALL